MDHLRRAAERLGYIHLQQAVKRKAAIVHMVQHEGYVGGGACERCVSWTVAQHGLCATCHWEGG